jgi:mRNA interferase MazF
MVSKTGYVPARGDIVWLDFNPQSGHEQAGRRPALVISPQGYNGKVGLALFCPITSHTKGYPFEVQITLEKKQSVILADQIKSLDWRQRNAKFIARADESALTVALQKIAVLTG